MWCLLPLQAEAACPYREHSCLWHPFGVTPRGTARGWDGEAMGQIPDELSLLPLQGHPEAPSEVSSGGGQKAQHLPQDSALRADDADETLCQGFSSARGDGRGQPAKALALFQAQPRAQLQVAQGTAQPPRYSLPTPLPGDGDLTLH